MIWGMVESLAARLKKDGSDLDGWVRLVRSYKVLGEPDKADTAAAEARRAFAGDPGKLQQLDASLKALELGDTSAAAPSRDAKSAGSRCTAESSGDYAKNGRTARRTIEVRI